MRPGRKPEGDSGPHRQGELQSSVTSTSDETYPAATISSLLKHSSGVAVQGYFKPGKPGCNKSTLNEHALTRRFPNGIT
jgi:hypothetical protein